MQVRERELRYGEAETGHQTRRPHIAQAAQTRHDCDHPERHDGREQRQLATHHGRELREGQPGDAGQGDERRSERTERDRRGVSDQREAGGLERREAKPDQHRGRDRHRRAEPRSTFDEGAEAEGDEERLHAPIVGEVGDGALQDLELPGAHRDVVEKDRVEHDPADGEEPKRSSVARRGKRERRRHPEAEDRDEQRRGETQERGSMRCHVQHAEASKQNDDRQCAEQCRAEHAAGRCVCLFPGHAAARLMPSARNSVRFLADPRFARRGFAAGTSCLFSGAPPPPRRSKSGTGPHPRGPSGAVDHSSHLDHRLAFRGSNLLPPL